MTPPKAGASPLSLFRTLGGCGLHAPVTPLPTLLLSEGRSSPSTARFSRGGVYTALVRRQKKKRREMVTNKEIVIKCAERPTSGCDEGCLCPLHLVNSASTQTDLLSREKNPNLFPSDLHSSFAPRAVEVEAPGAPRHGRSPPPLPERRRAGHGSTGPASGLSEPPRALTRPSEGVCTAHTEQPCRGFLAFFIYLLLLKLWHYLQWQWYRPAQEPLKEICLQVKSKKYFDS